MGRQGETSEHREAFELWYSYGRSVRKCAGEFNCSEDTIARWRQRYAWDHRADQRDAEASRIADERAVRRRAAQLARLSDAADALIERGIEFISTHEIADERAAIAAIREGAALVRGHDPLPAWLSEITAKTDKELMAEYERLRARVEGDGDKPVPLALEDGEG